jgi:membrane associated rhomboid family serine protease
MIPLKDIDRRPARVPLITSLIIAGNTLAFLFELMRGSAFVQKWSLVPSEIWSGKSPITFVTAMFMHGGLLHIAGNMIFLWAFGPEIEDMMGRARYAVFYLLGGMVAFAAHVALNPDSQLPVLGASGAIAAVMAAFLVTFPRDRIKTLVFLGFFVTILFIPATVLVGIWFLLQLISEAGTLAEHPARGGVAYGAHIGGFLFGLAFARLFDRGRPRGGNLKRSDAEIGSRCI